MADPSFDGGGNSLRQVPLRADLNYNWERGRWHPFVGTGVGAYFLQNKGSNGTAFGNQETKFGFNLGGDTDIPQSASGGQGRRPVAHDREHLQPSPPIRPCAQCLAEDPPPTNFPKIPPAPPGNLPIYQL